MKLNLVTKKGGAKMFLHKIVLATIISSSLIVMFPALAHDATINITGAVSNTTCSVSSDSINKSVDLGSYSITSFNSTGKSSMPAQFTINLENCGSISRGVEVKFTGTSDTAFPDYFKLSSDSTGSGVAIELTDDTKKLIPAGGTSKAYSISSGATTKSLVFYAQMVANGEKVESGSIISNVTFNTLYP